ncbi:VOC family protein [Sphingomonas sp. CGMCC 1.13654]|uniref:VOC family protein n=1 Tax=Sphingomonas chungangi TaxID=2683589 RepID=A0A838L262_9SPHN|nr:VOC family protein [Sphingomonas chungangi]MBA2933471.1 VOC family protein [Sphingomonas chungangi]MVW54804.1 metapyrocatechase [Sphingomonas chungangi]
MDTSPAGGPDAGTQESEGRGPAVHSLDSIALSVPALAEARHFHEAFGLDVREEQGLLLLRTFPGSHVWMRVRADAGLHDAKRLDHLRFGIFAGDELRFIARLTSLGIAFSQTIDGTLRLDGPGGIRIELVIAAKSSPDCKAMGEACEVVGGRGTGPRRLQPTVMPRRLAHIGLFVPDLIGAVAFFSEVLGLRLSDISGDEVAFLHGVHGSDHHMIALARSDAAGLHHSSWDVPSVQAVGLGAAQMAEAGFTAGWGLGRHVLGSNYFHYVRDPWGSYAEYSADMDFIPAGLAWDAKDHPAEDAFYQWGPPPPVDFGVNRDAR